MAYVIEIAGIVDGSGGLRAQRQDQYQQGLAVAAVLVPNASLL